MERQNLTSKFAASLRGCPVRTARQPFGAENTGVSAIFGKKLNRQMGKCRFNRTSFIEISYEF
jgi:hypothetical protein